MTWILQVRETLEQAGARRLEDVERRVVSMVPLFVDSGELRLWMIEQPSQLAGDLPAVRFPGREVEAERDPWSVTASIASAELGLTGAQVLRLGELDERRSFGDVPLLPAICAVPAGSGRDPLDGLFSVPLAALAQPAAVEQRVVPALGEDPVTVYTVLSGAGSPEEGGGERRIWGPALEIAEELLGLLGVAN